MTKFGMITQVEEKNVSRGHTLPMSQDPGPRVPIFGVALSTPYGLI